MFVPGSCQPPRVTLHRQYGQDLITVDAVGASIACPMYVYGATAPVRVWPALPDDEWSRQRLAQSTPAYQSLIAAIERHAGRA
jgi:hypothetical protein